jgi:hypothetical protein
VNAVAVMAAIATPFTAVVIAAAVFIATATAHEMLRFLPSIEQGAGRD